MSVSVCPRCGSKKYRIEDDSDIVDCNICGWHGDLSELVSDDNF